MKKGFTLIELLVVVAIIGILASVVLASLGTARQKGKNAAIKAELANARAQAEIYYDSNNNSYAGVCTDQTDGIAKLYQSALNKAGGQDDTDGTCQDDADSWVAAVELGSCFCVDYLGTAKEIESCDYSPSSYSCDSVVVGAPVRGGIFNPIEAPVPFR